MQDSPEINLDAISEYNPLYQYKLKMANMNSVPKAKLVKMQRASAYDVNTVLHINQYLNDNDTNFIELNVKKYLASIKELFKLYDDLSFNQYTDIYDFIAGKVSLFEKKFDDEIVWDIDHDLTLFVCNSFRLGLIDVKTHNDLFVKFILLKKKLVMKEIQLVHDFNSYVMNYFGRPITFLDAYELQKLKSIHAYLSGVKLEKISKDVYTVLNGSSIKKEDFIMMYFSQIFSLMYGVDYYTEINNLLVQNTNIECYPNEMISEIKRKIVGIVEEISSLENLESMLVMYLACRYVITGIDDFINIVSEFSNFVFTKSDIHKIQEIAKNLKERLNEKRDR